MNESLERPEQAAAGRPAPLSKTPRLAPSTTALHPTPPIIILAANS